MTPGPVLRSLQGRLLWLVLSGAVVVWLGAALIAWQDARHELDELLDSHLMQSASLLMLQANDEDDDISELPQLPNLAARVAFQVFVDGQLVTRSPNIGETPMASQLEGFSSLTTADGQSWRVYATHSARRDVTVQVAENRASREAILWALLRSMAGPMVLALPLLGLAVWWSVRQGLAPLRALRSVLAGRPPQAIDPMPVNRLPRELRPVVLALNALLERIRVMVESERRFTADAAHELRTPIAAIRTQAQVALGAGADQAGRDHALRQTIAGCDRANNLVGQLLQLARLEHNTAVDVRSVELADVVRLVCADLQGAALQRRQMLHVQAAPCVVVADAALLSVLVRNLLDNALRYSPDGALVRVSTATQADGTRRLEVRDSGPGMAPEAIAHLGERFFRVLGSDQPGSGLGWSIVQRVLQVVGGRADIRRCESLGGLAVVVEWPTVTGGDGAES